MHPGFDFLFLTMKHIRLQPTGVQLNENQKACASCKSRCCERMPGIVFPHQLKVITVTAIQDMLAFNYCLDWWEGDPRPDAEQLPAPFSRVLYIRPRIKGTNQVFHPAWVGECVFLTHRGCLLRFQNRPFECQVLVPNINHKCAPDRNHIQGSGKHAAALAWLPYQTILQEAGHYVQKRYQQS